MSNPLRRYVFIDFDSLKRVKFKKLEKVCDKLFVLIHEEEENIPVHLVMNMQRLGRNVKWITIGHNKEITLNYHLCFLMGKLHERVSKDIEFAILSNDKSFDPLINYINSNGRSCLRVKRKKEKNALAQKEFPVHTNGELPKGIKTDDERLPFILEPNGENTQIEVTANETVERLKYSGNRPSQLLLLKDYILLHNQEVNGNADQIIDLLVERQKIKIEEGTVKYNF